MSDETPTLEETPAARLLPQHPVLRALFEGFEAVEWESSLGQDVARVPNETWAEFAQAARHAGFEMCVDVTVVDWMRERSERFEIVANLLSMSHKLRLRMMTTAGRIDPSV
ncbi:MAG: NADH-quinone oxidoreductase subunit C, partial [Acidimicrobiia bacterium]